MTTTVVSEANIRKNTFKTIYEFISTYKSSTWNLMSAFPMRTSDLPVIIINPASIRYENVSYDGSARTNYITILIEFYDLAKNGKNSVDSEKDKIADAFYSHMADFHLNRGLIFRHIEDEESDEMLEGGNKINYGGFRAYFYLN